MYFLIDTYVHLEKSVHVRCSVNYPKDEYPAVTPARSGQWNVCHWEGHAMATLMPSPRNEPTPFPDLNTSLTSIAVY